MKGVLTSKHLLNASFFNRHFATGQPSSEERIFTSVSAKTATVHLYQRQRSCPGLISVSTALLVKLLYITKSKVWSSAFAAFHNENVLRGRGIGMAFK